MPVGQLVKKFTWLLDNVEVKGIVRSIEADGFAIEPDANYSHLIALMSGNNPLPWNRLSTTGRIHCETYPLSPDSINRVEPWFLPQKNTEVPFAVRHPVTGWQEALKEGDHVQVVGRWVIDHHPEFCDLPVNDEWDPPEPHRCLILGVLRAGAAHMELHPFRWDDIRLVLDLSPGDVREETLSLAAPLHEHVFHGGWKWAANELAGVASKIYINDDASNYHNSVSADIRVKAPQLPTGFNPHSALIGFQEEVLRNGTGLDVAQLRSLNVIDDGIRVQARVNAPATQQIGGFGIADTNDPANDRSVFQARYRVWWLPRLVALNRQAEPLGRIELAPQSVSASVGFEIFFRNRGPDPLQITGAAVVDDPEGVFQLSPVAPATLPPGYAQDVSGTFKPTRAGAFAGTIVVQSNDPAHQRVTVEVRGSGVPATTRPAVCSSDPGSDRLDLFMRGADDALWYRWFGGNPWSGPDWRSLGGVLTSEPAAVALAPGLIYSFVRGTDNALWYGWLSDEVFSAGGSLGGVLTSAPAACSTGSDRLDVFVRGTDNAVWYRRFDGQAWSAWDSLGGVAASAPAATAMGGAAWVFVRGTDNALWYRWVRGPGDLSGWQRLEGVLTSGPAVCAPTSDQEALDVFVRGTDNGIWYSRLGAQGWSSWEGLGGGVIADPAATAMGGASWVVVRGTDGALYFRWRNGPGTGSDWQRFPM